MVLLVFKSFTVYQVQYKQYVLFHLIFTNAPLYRHCILQMNDWRARTREYKCFVRALQPGFPPGRRSLWTSVLQPAQPLRLWRGPPAWPASWGLWPGLQTFVVLAAEGGSTGFWWVEGRDATQHPAVNMTPPRELPQPEASSARTTKPCSAVAPGVTAESAATAPLGNVTETEVLLPYPEPAELEILKVRPTHLCFHSPQLIWCEGLRATALLQHHSQTSLLASCLFFNSTLYLGWRSFSYWWFFLLTWNLLEWRERVVVPLTPIADACPLLNCLALT